MVAEAEGISVDNLTDSRLQMAVENKDYSKVIQYLLAYLKSNPHDLIALQQLGNAYYQQQDYDNAITYYQSYADLKKDETIMFQIGKCYLDRRDPIKAIPYLSEAYTLNPTSILTHVNLSTAYCNSHEYELALPHLNYLFDKGHKNASVLTGLGLSYLEIGDLKSSEYFFRWACEIEDEVPWNHTNLAMVLLRQKKFKEGWYQFRWLGKVDLIKKRDLTMPTWRGEEIPGKTLFLGCDQGVGDNIQLIRYIPLLEQRNIKVILECYDSLYRVCSQLKGLNSLVRVGEKMVNSDYYCPLFDLPGIFSTDYENIPYPDSYLQVRDEDVKLKKNLFKSTKNLKVGIVWAGNPKHVHDFKRSIPLPAWVPILQVKGVQFYSLQKPPASAQLSELSYEIIDISEHLGDFYDTAACISHLDLIITVDTSIAHLAGALGRPVWTLLSLVPDWRWTMEGSTTPWYRSMRLYRQQQISQWEEVIERVARDLAKLSRAKKKK